MSSVSDQLSSLELPKPLVITKLPLQEQDQKVIGEQYVKLSRSRPQLRLESRKKRSRTPSPPLENDAPGQKKQAAASRKSVGYAEKFDSQFFHEFESGECDEMDYTWDETQQPKIKADEAGNSRCKEEKKYCSA
ncbi:hypothetical protein PtB15_9B37 [Puccinia triticina]|nr:hypothetical protein PtB15_9B37 [Puccinia triticina]